MTEDTWKLSVSMPIRICIDLSILAILLMTLYLSIFADQGFLVIVHMLVFVSYIVYIYRGFYDMHVKLGKDSMHVSFFPVVKFDIPYKKIRKIETAERKWKDFLTGYGFKVRKSRGGQKAYLRSRMSGEVAVIHLNGFKFSKIELTVNSPEYFVDAVKRKI